MFKSRLLLSCRIAPWFFFKSNQIFLRLRRAYRIQVMPIAFYSHHSVREAMRPRRAPSDSSSTSDQSCPYCLNPVFRWGWSLGKKFSLFLAKQLSKISNSSLSIVLSIKFACVINKQTDCSQCVCVCVVVCVCVSSRSLCSNGVVVVSPQLKYFCSFIRN